MEKLPKLMSRNCEVLFIMHQVGY